MAQPHKGEHGECERQGQEYATVVLLVVAQIHVVLLDIGAFKGDKLSCFLYGDAQNHAHAFNASDLRMNQFEARTSRDGAAKVFSIEILKEQGLQWQKKIVIVGVA